MSRSARLFERLSLADTSHGDASAKSEGRSDSPNVFESATVPCEECGTALGPDSDLRLEAELLLDGTERGEAYIYCPECWAREFGDEA